MAFPPVPPSHQQPQPPELNYLLMDVANTTQEITSRLTARAFSAIAHPEQGPALREVMRELLFLLDEIAEGPGCQSRRHLTPKLLGSRCNPNPWLPLGLANHQSPPPSIDAGIQPHPSRVPALRPTGHC